MREAQGMASVRSGWGPGVTWFCYCRGQGGGVEGGVWQNPLGIYNSSKKHCREKEEIRLKEISPGISLEGMMLKLKLQYFGHLM